MFIKPDDNINRFHLTITSDNTGTTNVPSELDFGYFAEDMSSVEPMDIALGFKRLELYNAWKDVFNNPPQNPPDKPSTLILV